MRAVETITLCAFLAGCAPTATTVKTAPPKETHVEMEPVRFQAASSGEVQLVDPQAVLDRGSRLYTDGKYEDALAAFVELQHDFPESKLRVAAAYNQALTLEKLGRLDDALGVYAGLIDDLDAQYRHATLLLDHGRLKDADAAWQKLLGRTDLSLSDRIQAMAQRGATLLKQNDMDSAEKLLRSAMTLYKEHKLEERLDNDYFLAFAAYQLAEISHAQFRLLPIRLPEARMKDDLELKAQMLLLAQRRYLDCMQVNHVEWAVAAGFQIGAMYREMYDAFLNAPIPPDAKGELREVYVDQLKKKVRPLLEKAVGIFERNLTMVERAGWKKTEGGVDWKERSQAELAALQALLMPGAPAAPPTTPAPPTPDRPAAERTPHLPVAPDSVHRTTM